VAEGLPSGSRRPSCFILGYLRPNVVDPPTAVPAQRKILSLAALCLALVGATVLSIDYYVQFALGAGKPAGERNERAAILIPSTTPWSLHRARGCGVPGDEPVVRARSLRPSSSAVGSRPDSVGFQTAFGVSVVAIGRLLVASKHRRKGPVRSRNPLGLLIRADRNGALLAVFFQETIEPWSHLRNHRWRLSASVRGRCGDRQVCVLSAAGCLTLATRMPPSAQGPPEHV